MRLRSEDDIGELDFAKGDGLIPVIVQHALTGELLMLAYADREAVTRTLESGEMYFRSRSRDELWHKGATSGNVQRLVELRADCDRDTLCAHVLPAGPACHTGAPGCFDAAPTLTHLERVLDARAEQRPEDSYTARLLGDANLRYKKIGEESSELVAAAAAGGPEQLRDEAADLLYHVFVACRAADVSVSDVLAELERRTGRDD